MQSHISALQRGVQNLKRTQEDILRKNQQLKEEVDRLHNEAELSIQPSPVKSRGKGNPLLHVKVKELELEVRRLKKVTRIPSTTLVFTPGSGSYSGSQEDKTGKY